MEFISLDKYYIYIYNVYIYVHVWHLMTQTQEIFPTNEINGRLGVKDNNNLKKESHNLCSNPPPSPRCCLAKVKVRLRSMV